LLLLPIQIGDIMLRCNKCHKALQVAHKNNNCFACKYYKGFISNKTGFRYKIIQYFIGIL